MTTVNMSEILDYTLHNPRNYKSGQFLHFRRYDGVSPHIETGKITFDNIEFAAGSLDFITFPIPRIKSEDLYSEITNFEDKLVLAFMAMKQEYYLNLPFYVQNVINQLKPGHLGNALRRNYLTNNVLNGPYDEVMYLKGHLKTMEIFKYTRTEERVPIAITDLGPGEYKFIINISQAYFGPHSRPNKVYNLYARIAEIRYRPFSELPTPPPPPHDDTQNPLPTPLKKKTGRGRKSKELNSPYKVPAKKSKSKSVSPPAITTSDEDTVDFNWIEQYLEGKVDNLAE